jgi:hypothetical protein
MPPFSWNTLSWPRLRMRALALSQRMPPVQYMSTCLSRRESMFSFAQSGNSVLTLICRGGRGRRSGGGGGRTRLGVNVNGSPVDRSEAADISLVGVAHVDDDCVVLLQLLVVVLRREVDRAALYRGRVLEPQPVVDQLFHREHLQLGEGLRRVSKSGARRVPSLSRGEVVGVLEVVVIFHVLKVSPRVVAHVASEPSDPIVRTYGE